MPLVGTALAHLADDAASRAAVLGAVATRIGFLLVDRAIRKAEAAEVVEWIGDVNAVNVISVFRHTGSTKRNGGARTIVESTASGDRTWRQQRNRFGTTSQRQRCQLFGRDHRTRAGGADVDLRCIGGSDRDRAERRCIGTAAGSCAGKRHLGAGSDAQLHVLAGVDDLIATLQGDGVGADRQRAEVVTAIGVDGDRTAEAGVALNDDGAAGFRGSATVDAAGGALCVDRAIGETGAEHNSQSGALEGMATNLIAHS